MQFDPPKEPKVLITLERMKPVIFNDISLRIITFL